GKHPRIRTGIDHADGATVDRETIRGWFGRWPESNLGVMTGPISGVVVLDVDGDTGRETLARLEAVLGPLPPTPTSRTGSGGLHYLFAHPGQEQRVVNRAHALGPCLDIRGNGGLFVMPPSLHLSGNRYQWILSPEQVALAPYDWLARAHAYAEEQRRPATPPPAPTNVVPLRQDQATIMRRACAYLARMSPSISGAGGHSAAWEAALALVRGFELPVEDALALLISDFNPRCEPQWSERELRHKVESASKADTPSGYLLQAALPARPERRRPASPATPEPPAWVLDGPPVEDRPERLAHHEIDTPAVQAPAPEIRNRTDLGNAERLVGRHGTDLRHCGQLGWLCWDGQRWRRDCSGEIVRRAKDTVRTIYEEAAAAYGDEERKAVAKWALASESRARVDSMIALAGAEAAVAVGPEVFDADPWLLTVAGGTIDLRTGQLREHRREDLATKLAPVDYDPDLPADVLAPRWHTFLEEVQPDPEIRAFLARLAGYALSGVIREHVLPINYGGGRNGKSVFVDTLLHVLGDYGSPIPTELLMEKHGDAHPSERATLWGLRFAVAAETEEGRALNVALVKQLTGGDKITSRFMHKDWFSFSPTHKILLSTNNRPQIRETQNAIWARVLLIPWTVTIPPERQDTALGEKLRAEAPGILRWAVDGCLEWQRIGLAPPAEVLAATQDYRTGQDRAGAFFDECCTFLPGAKIAYSALAKEYQQWCEKNGEKPLGPARLGERLAQRGARADRFRVGGKLVRGWVNVGLREEEEYTSDVY
ncbi:MAG: phage/plasmid primase, P4 family, partial [Myxococcota bacterium]|nr:phage/plasmid primase, P4 family [Myxococcota bacterium]